MKMTLECILVGADFLIVKIPVGWVGIGPVQQEAGFL